MLYLDLTSTELDKLLDFHTKHPGKTLRIYSDEVLDPIKHTYKKRVTDLEGNETNIADPTFD